MPPRKIKPVEQVEPVERVVEPVERVEQKTFNTLVKYNSNDNDRIQLAQAINNLNLKGDLFV